MSTFETPVIRVESVENVGDRLQLNRFGEFQALSQRGSYNVGDLAVFIGPDSVLPNELKEILGVPKNRIKCIKLRGVFSDGLLYRPDGVDLEEGVDMSSELGIVKYEQPLGRHKNMFATNIKGSYVKSLMRFDLENGRKYASGMFDGTDRVVVTEKLHGSQAQFVISKTPFPEQEALGYERPWLLITSKGRAKSGFAIRHDENNIWSNMAKRLSSEFDEIHEMLKRSDTKESITFVGEIFGKGVQDMTYGLEDTEFRVFDVAINGRYVDHWNSVQAISSSFGLITVPVIYCGGFAGFSKHLTVYGIEEMCEKSEFFPESIMEGFVVRLEDYGSKPAHKTGRNTAKFVGPQYLTRKGGTEFQ